MRVRYTAAENALCRELREQLKNTDSEISRGKLRESLQRIRDSAKKSAAARADKAADSIAPKRAEFGSEEEFVAALELHRLNLSAMACNRTLDSPKVGLRARIQAEKKLEELASRRLKIEGKPDPLPDPLPQPLPDFSKLSDDKLRNDFAWQKWARANLDITNNGKLIAALEIEIRRRKMPLYWSVADTKCEYVDERSEPVNCLSGHVYMGVAPHRDQSKP
jgi:hypothetical protein